MLEIRYVTTDGRLGRFFWRGTFTPQRLIHHMQNVEVAILHVLDERRPPNNCTLDHEYGCLVRWSWHPVPPKVAAAACKTAGIKYEDPIPMPPHQRNYPHYSQPQELEEHGLKKDLTVTRIKPHLNVPHQQPYLV